MKTLITLFSLQFFLLISTALAGDGFRLTDFKEKSILSSVGFKKGDVIKTINGSTTWMAHPQDIGDMFKTPGAYEVEIERAGKPQKISFTVK